MKRNDIRNEGPWVIIDPKDYSILQKGLFCDLVGKQSGHLMTESLYLQILDERYQ
jgi:hypothetical protein